jgi:hypothetical protein
VSEHYGREQILAIVEGSPKAVAVHDRQAWQSLYARHNVVEDPVGSRPHHSGVLDRTTGKRGNGPLERFYDTFIAPNEITFYPNQDIVSGRTVIRDLTIETRMSTGIVAQVPMYVVYELVEEEDGLKICRLAAHWELVPMLKQVLGQGLSGVRSLVLLGIRMMRRQGLGGSLGFARGFRGIAKQGKRAVQDFTEAAQAGDTARLSRLFHSDGSTIEFPVEEGGTGRRYAPSSFLEHGNPRISVSRMISAGFTTMFHFEVEHQGAAHRGTGLFEFNAKTRRIDRARFFWEVSGR